MANVQIRSFGGLNTDTHVQDLRNGDYPDAKNIDHISAVTGESVAVTPRMGNDYAFELGEVTAQDKRYVITFPEVEPDGGYQLQVNRADQINPLFPAFEVPLYDYDPDVPPGDQAATTIQNAFETALYPVTVVHASTVYPELIGSKSLLITPSSNSVSLRYYDYFIQSIGQNALTVDVIQESISNSRIGKLEVIGSKDLLGDLFIISSSKRDKPFEIKIIDISIIVFAGISTLLVTPEATNEVLEDEQEVYITGVEGIPEANGVFVIKIYQDPQTGNNIILLYNSFAAPGQTYVQGTGTITFNKFGMGEIGVAEKDISSNTWKYTRLLRSKQLNLFTYHQCDVQGEKSSYDNTIYFTDNYNEPRLFNYKLNEKYVEDGAIKILHPDIGTYSYSNISNQVRHILGQALFNIELVSQTIGGTLSVGNHVYFVRGVLSDNSYTDWSLPSRFVSVYTESQPPAYKIKGNAAGDQSGKTNNIRITNINSSLYKSVEVACIIVNTIGVDSSIYGIIGEYRVDGTNTTLDISHSGRENPRLLNQDELGIQTENYSTAKNNLIIDNRYYLSNLKTIKYDVKILIEKIKYSLKKKTITRPVQVSGTFGFGGHQDPINIYYYTGYMINETYRIGVRFTFKNGDITPVYKVSDITIDTEQSSSDNKRTSGLTDYDLVSPGTGPGGTDENLVPYIELDFSNVYNTLLNEFLANDIIDKIEIFRVELNEANETITGCGIAVQQIDANIGFGPYEVQISPTLGSFVYEKIPNNITTNNENYIADYPFISNNNNDIQSDGGAQNYFSIYLAESMVNIVDGVPYNKDIGAGDTIINYGQGVLGEGYVITNNVKEDVNITDSKLVTQLGSALFVQGTGANTFNSISFKNWGWAGFSQSALPTVLYVSNLHSMGGYNVTFGGVGGSNYTFTYNGQFVASYFVGFGGITNTEFFTYFNNDAASSGVGISVQGQGGDACSFQLAPGSWVSGAFLTINGSGNVGTFPAPGSAPPVIFSTDIFQSPASYVVQVPSPGGGLPRLNPFKVNPTDKDRGYRIVQIKKKSSTTQQYSESGLDNYVYTGAYIYQNNVTKVDVFGGDTFTVNPYFKHITRIKPINNAGTYPTAAQTINLTLQSKVNNYLIDDSDGSKIYPYSYGPNNFGAWENTEITLDSNPYNNGYSLNNIQVGYRSGEINNKTKALNTRIIYSDNKPQGSITNNYRRFGQTSYNDLDPSFGPIEDMKVVNGELFTLQTKKFQKQFVNTRGTLSVSDGSQVVLGDAGVLSRPGLTITSYGCSDKWSSFLGKSAGGDDTLYWYDSINKKFMRFGADGAVPISDRTNIRTLANDGFKWVINYQTPADNYGIHGIWNQRINEASWTCRAYRKPDVIWQPLTAISEGQLVVTYDTTNTYGFEMFPILYLCIQSSQFNNALNPGVDAGWEEYYTPIPFDDIEYYSLRTIVWSEAKNRFIISEETPHPRIYLQYKDTFLSPSPSSNSNQLFEHNEGRYLEWYMSNGGGQSEDGYIDIVFNIDPNTTKHFISLICNTEIAPYKVEAFTKNHTTLINPVEFLEQLDQYVAPIPNDLQNGSTGLDNTFLYGQWIKVRFHYQAGVFQRLTNMILKFNPMARLWNS